MGNSPGSLRSADSQREGSIPPSMITVTEAALRIHDLHEHAGGLEPPLHGSVELRLTPLPTEL